MSSLFVHSLLKKISYLPSLVKFTISVCPIYLLCPVLALLSAAFEIIAMLSLPLISGLTFHEELDTTNLIFRGFHFFNFEVSLLSILQFFLIMLFLRFSLYLLFIILAQSVSKKMLYHLHTKSLNNIVSHFSLSKIYKNSIGYYITLLGDESSRASVVLFELNIAFASGIMALLYYMSLLYLNIWVGLSLFIFFAGLAISTRNSFSFLYELGKKRLYGSQITNSLYMDMLNGVRTMRAFMLEKFFMDLYRLELRKYTRILLKTEVAPFILKFIPLLFLLIIANIFLGYAQSTNFFTHHPMNITLFITTLFFLFRFFPVAGQAFHFFLKVLSDSTGGQDILSLSSACHTPIEAKNPMIDTINSLSLQSISYQYQAGDKPIFHQINLKFVRGKTYAITGESGCGKSTLLNLLCGLEEPVSGRILVNDQPLTNSQLIYLRRKILLIDQQTVIFNDSIEKNILLDQPGTAESFNFSTILSNLNSFIETLPKKEKTLIDYNGANLSGGQKQRIGIARALVRSPEILLLDEGTSALDKENRDLVIQNLITLFREKILIVVTHDKEVSRKMDVIIHIDKDKIQIFDNPLVGT